MCSFPSCLGDHAIEQNLLGLIAQTGSWLLRISHFVLTPALHYESWKKSDFLQVSA